MAPDIVPTASRPLHPASESGLSSDALDPRGFMDPRYTCDLDNSSPEIRWHLTETGATLPLVKGFALIADDLDGPKTAESPLYVHWLVYNIPANIRHLPAGIPAQETLPNGIRQGINSLGKLGYTGPCPPMRGGAHQYRFRLFLLRQQPDMPPRMTCMQLLAEIEPQIISSRELVCRYARTLARAG